MRVRSSLGLSSVRIRILFMEVFFFPFIVYLSCWLGWIDERLAGETPSTLVEVWRKLGGFNSDEGWSNGPNLPCLMGDLDGLQKFLRGIDQAGLSCTGRGRGFLAYQSGWSPKVYHSSRCFRRSACASCLAASQLREATRVHHWIGLESGSVTVLFLIVACGLIF